MKKNEIYPVVPIGTNKSSYIRKKMPTPIRIGFIGVTKRSQGLDMLFKLTITEDSETIERIK
jgi:hypothetical protein